jgi:hypothetical protein
MHLQRHSSLSLSKLSKLEGGISVQGALNPDLEKRNQHLTDGRGNLLFLLVVVLDFEW